MIFALILCAAGQLPAGCPTLPARHSGSVAGPWCCPVKIGPTRSRPVVLPTCRAAGRLPTCCPWCCRPVNSRPVAPRSRPVTREALPARGAARSRSAPRSRPRGAADVPRCRSTLLYAALPALFRRASGATALRRRANRYNRTHFHFFCPLFCYFPPCIADNCP